jgi:hypothetical protein
MKTFALPILAVLLSVLTTATVSAQCSSCQNPARPGVAYVKAFKPVDARIQTAITDVNGNSVTVSEAKTSKTYQVDAGTKVSVNGNSTGVERLQAGMRVTVTASLLKPSVARTIVAQSGK